jgi:hypothetical protein
MMMMMFIHTVHTLLLHELTPKGDVFYLIMKYMRFF